MNKCLAFLFTLFSLTLASSLWAFQVPPQPESCPEAAVIHQTPFFTAQKLADGTYGAA